MDLTHCLFAVVSRFKFADPDRNLSRLYYSKTTGMGGRQKRKQAGPPELRIDSIKLSMRWHAEFGVASLECLQRTQEASSHIAWFQRDFNLSGLTFVDVIREEELSGPVRIEAKFGA